MVKIRLQISADYPMRIKGLDLTEQQQLSVENPSALGR